MKLFGKTLDGRARAAISNMDSLTKVEGKLEYFQFDPYFRDGCDDFNDLSSQGVDVDLWNCTFIVFRPDSIVTRSVMDGIRFLEKKGLSVLGSFQFEYSHLRISECWRYQHNVNSRERIEAMRYLMCSTPSLLFLLKSNSENAVPASVKLKMLKGSSIPEKRKPGHLRYEMSETHASMFSLIHAPDEPLDLLRELSVFLEPAIRKQAYSMLSNSYPEVPLSEVQNLVEKLYDETPMHDLNPSNLLDRLEERGEVSTEFLRKLKDNEAPPLFDTLKVLQKDSEFSSLDAAVIASRFGEGHIKDVETVLPDANPMDWIP